MGVPDLLEIASGKTALAMTLSYHFHLPLTRFASILVKI